MLNSVDIQQSHMIFQSIRNTIFQQIYDDLINKDIDITKIEDFMETFTEGFKLKNSYSNYTCFLEYFFTKKWQR